MHFLWQIFQNYKFEKSQEKPYKMPILNREVRPPTLNFWHFFWFRMVPYGPNIGVPGFPRFFAFLQHSNDRACLYALPPQAEAVNNTLRQIKCIQLQLKVIGQGTPMLALRDFTLQQTVCHMLKLPHLKLPQCFWLVARGDWVLKLPQCSWLVAEGRLGAEGATF